MYKQVNITVFLKETVLIEVCSKVSPESGFIKMHVKHSGFLVIFTILYFNLDFTI